MLWWKSYIKSDLKRCTEEELLNNFGLQYETDRIGYFFIEAPYQIPKVLLPMLRLFEKGDAVPSFYYNQKISISYLLVNMLINAFAVELAMQLLTQDAKKEILEFLDTELFQDEMRLLPEEERVSAVFETVTAKAAMHAVVSFDSPELKIQNNVSFTSDLHGQLDFLSWYIDESQHRAPSEAQRDRIIAYRDQLPAQNNKFFELNSMEDYGAKLKWILDCLIKLYQGSFYNQPPILKIIQEKKMKVLKSAQLISTVDYSYYSAEILFKFALEHYLKIKYYNGLEDVVTCNDKRSDGIGFLFDRLHKNCFLFDILTLTQQQELMLEKQHYSKEMFDIKSNLQGLPLSEKQDIILAVEKLAASVKWNDYILHRLQTLALSVSEKMKVCNNIDTAFQWFGTSQIRSQVYFEMVWESYLYRISLSLPSDETFTKSQLKNLRAFQKKMFGYLYIKKHYDFTNCQKMAPTEDSIKEALHFLGIPKANLKSLSSEEIQKNYKRLARKCHPDKFGGNDSAQFIKLTKCVNDLQVWLESQSEFKEETKTQKDELSRVNESHQKESTSPLCGESIPPSSHVMSAEDIMALFRSYRDRDRSSDKISNDDLNKLKDQLKFLKGKTSTLERDLPSLCASFGNAVLKFILCLSVVGALIAMVINRSLPDQFLGRDAYRYSGKTFLFFQGDFQKSELDYNEARNILNRLELRV